MAANVDWNAIKAEYIKGGISYRAIAAKYGITKDTVCNQAKRDKWQEAKRRAASKLATKIVNQAVEEEAKRFDKAANIADKLLDMIDKAIDDGSITITARGLRDVTGALKDIRDIKGIMSDLDYQEQVARIEKLRKDVASNDVNKEIKVTISGELEEYSN